MLTSTECQLMKISATDMMMMCGAQGASVPTYMHSVAILRQKFGIGGPLVNESWF